MKKDIKFTVFTPVYNRKHTITRVWRSLQRQSYRNFEWIIVDDGSTDGVWDLLTTWRKNANFCIILLQQENLGKHVAWNRAVKVARGELFVPADSDDSFEPETLERFAFHWSTTIPESERLNYSGINVLCKNPKTDEIIGDYFPSSQFISNNLDLHFKYKIVGEKWGCIRTDILKERPFKEVKGSFLSENYVWFYIARNYNVLCVNEALRNYYTNDDVCLTKPKASDLLKSAESFYISQVWNLSTNFDYISKYDNSMSIVKQFINLWRYAFLSNVSIKSVLLEISDKRLKIITILFLFPSYLIYFLTFRKIKINANKNN